MRAPIWATSPLPWTVLGVLLLVVLWRHLPRWLRVSGLVIELALVGLTTPLGAGVLELAAEARAPSASACPAPIPHTVVVLGGGFNRSPRNVGDFGALHLGTLQRVFAGVDLWRTLGGARLVISGGAGPRALPEAILMTVLATRLGVPRDSIEIDPRSHNTWQNARNVSKLSPPVAKRIWLVTSPMHLPRALGAFRAWGFDPCAWPAGPARARLHFQLSDFIPQGSSSRTAALALHELVGSAEYAVLEWRHAQDVD